MALLDFQFVFGRHNIRPPHFASKVSYSASPQTFAECSRGTPCSDAALACYLLKNEPKFFWILNALLTYPSRRSPTIMKTSSFRSSGRLMLRNCSERTHPATSSLFMV